eukprot:CAMPEP_0183408298 /NCGR_PEP_ID=MMETSP0370-20130417/17983_1 /TAXON_ID=268820 /ORGANISM="Peridinium aciculiferum, Strain PAER-2" /LENGTH=115 /DNA_ID=CAMNT_0025590783 /DNA_START=64 /DNA_END=408 /DNA_ORIENTATION=-
MRSILQVPQWLARTYGGNANSARTPHAQRGPLMSTISGNLHLEQQLGLASPLNPKLGFFPHLHVALTRSTMPTDLQLAQWPARESSGMPKIDCLPHAHRGCTTLQIMPSVLQSMQ